MMIPELTHEPPAALPDDQYHADTYHADAYRADTRAIASNKVGEAAATSASFPYRLTLVVTSALLHFLFLGQPAEVVFDEVHFGKFITDYCCTKTRFFDIHPPLAKLAIAATAWLGGFRGGLSFEHIGQAYGAVPVVAARFLPALIGTLLPLCLFVLLKKLGASKVAAFAGSMALALDNALLIQTRMISLDGILLFGSLVGLWLTLVAFEGQGRWLAAVGAGLFIGLACGTKFTGLAFLGLAGVIWLRRFIQVGFAAWKRWIGLGLVTLASAATLYMGGWYLHFKLLTVPGNGDLFYRPTGHWLIDTWRLHGVMLRVNYGLTAVHHDASPWWKWPFMNKPIYYWHGAQGDIYFLGNPIVWWGVTALFAVALVHSAWRLFKRRQPSSGWRPLWLPLCAYLMAFLPLARVPRVLFLYHYLTPLLCALIYVVLWLDQEGAFIKARRRWLYVALGLMVVGFALVSPYTYGFSVPNAYKTALFGVLPGLH